MRLITLALAGLCLAAGVASAPAAVSRPAVLSDQGIGSVRLGTQQSQAVAALSGVLGRPTRLPNTGCGPRYTEVAWEHLYVEFRRGRFTGYRYMDGRWPAGGNARRPAPASPVPKLATSTGITLGSTLGQLRAAYRRLDLIGTDRWQARDGLFFYDNAEHEPPPASSRFIEIKFGTCGDF
jgi:hypothetical protein